MKIRHAGDTSPGRKRIRNEDAFVRDPPLFAVADGMGGAQAGELASGLAADALRDELRDRHLRRDLTGLRAAHAVGDGEQRRLVVVVVLVGVPLAPNVGLRCVVSDP